MSRFYINDNWRFAFDNSNPRFEDVRIPHTVKETPLNYFSEDGYQTVSRYETEFFAPLEWRGNKVLITFDGVAHYAEVFLNGERIGEHYSGYTAFTLDISDMIEYGEDNELCVVVDSRENLNIPPFGNVIDYMTYGGIYRDVYIDVKPTTYLQDIFARANMKGELYCDIDISGEITSQMTIRQSIFIDEEWRLLAEGVAKEHMSTFSIVKDALLWSVDEPNLYTIRTELWQGNDPLNIRYDRIGFRDAEFRKDGFYLNGKKLKLRGLNRHQSYPYVGYAMPRSMQEMDAEVLKYELGLNTVRTSHYPQSHYFLDRCDEIGLLVITEIPGWQHIGDDAWQDQAVKNVKEMILQYRNHPSIILWGVRINESRDNEELYKRTNALAHELDPTRATCGVRNFRKSQLLEDVYTYNEFIHDGKKPGCEPKAAITSDVNKPYMITEYNGHMYPTKAFDCEEHRVEHALRHARVLNAVASYDDIAGSCGWCMADYNTHKDFGSGDRICYHGVTDMFRNPKLAAAVYSSQGDLPVLEISSSMDIGEHPACIKGRVWMFTNADSVKMYKNGKFIKEFAPNNEDFPDMVKSPILIDDYVGDQLIADEKMPPEKAKYVSMAINHMALNGFPHVAPIPSEIANKCLNEYGMTVDRIIGLYGKYVENWGAKSSVYRFDAIVDGRVVKTVTKAAMNKMSLELQVSHTDLHEGNSYDVAAVRVRAVDENGNLLPYSNEAIKLTAEGPIEFIGPDILALRGGMAGFYVKTTGEKGAAKAIISCPRVEDMVINFEIN